MVGTLFLILVFILIFLVMMFSLLLIKHPAGFGVFVISGACILFILIMNMGFIVSPRTKKETFKVIDSTTQAPIPNAQVIIGWAVHYATIGGNSPRCYYKIIRTTSDAKGEFVVPPAYKTLNFHLLGFYIQEFSGIDISIFDYAMGYSCKRIKMGSVTDNVITLANIKTRKDLLQSVVATYDVLDNAKLDCTGNTIINQSDISYFKTSSMTLMESLAEDKTSTFSEEYKLVDIMAILNQPEAYFHLKKSLGKYKDIPDKSYYDRKLRVFEKIFLKPESREPQQPAAAAKLLRLEPLNQKEK